MAIAIYGNIITDMKGSVGGWTFQHSKAGKIVRQKPFQLKSQTTNQTLEHSNLQRQLQRYNETTFAQKLAWMDFANAHTKVNLFGETKTLTGFNWFVAINENLKRIEESEIMNPPTYEISESPTAYNLNLGDDSIAVEFVSTFNPADTALFIRASQPIRGANGNLRPWYRLVQIELEPPWSEIEITTLWNQYFKLDWSTITGTGNFQITAMLTTINKNSGISSPGVIVTNNHAA